MISLLQFKILYNLFIEVFNINDETKSRRKECATPTHKSTGIEKKQKERRTGQRITGEKESKC